MNGRIWIVAMALVWAWGCERASEGDAMDTPAPATSSVSSLTRHCCDRTLSDCVAEPKKACTEEDGRPVINWE